MTKRRSLRHRILTAVSLISLLICAVFSVYTVAFTYSVEDAFLAARLETEGLQLREIHSSSGRWTPPRDKRLSLHLSVETLPVIVQAGLAAEPNRVEFQAPGPSHYHLLALGEGEDTAWLLYDAGRDLIVPRMRNKLLAILAVSAIGLVGVALLVGYLAIRRTTRQLEFLATNVAGLDPDRMTTSWEHLGSSDEVDILASRLGEMTTRLREFVERERSFTRDASHELRSPLTVIRAAGDQLYAQPGLDEHARERAKLILDSADRLENTVATLLALAREEHTADPVNARLLPIIEQTVLDQSSRLEGKPVELEIDVDAEATILVSASVARIILSNLVGNAFSHTFRGLIEIKTDDDCLRISNPSHIDDAPSQALAASPISAADGHGFGLTIVRRLCARFQVEIMISVDRDRFIVTLPISRKDPRS